MSKQNNPEYEKYKLEMLRASRPLPEDLQAIVEKLGCKHFISHNPHVRNVQDMLRKHFPRWEEPPFSGYLERLWDQLESLVGEKEALSIVKQCINKTLERKPRGAPKDNPHMKYFTHLVFTQIKGYAGEL